MATLRFGSKCSSRRGGTARRPAFAENLHVRDRCEVPPSGGALNPDPHFLKRVLVLCLISLFKKYGFAIEPFSLLRDRKCSMSLEKGFRLAL